MKLPPRCQRLIGSAVHSPRYLGRLALYVGLAAIVYIGARSRLGAQPQLEVKR
ncbi:hypothetical protein [Pseudomonas paeninsulae]|uniref:hypothetical protein n=1 Tax=Pseudomonas paeninsulae TaxID=3110772 RepID=UPI002D7788DB|nr:hypothetical protein [Pseudomonas sp. IT1137]